MEMGPRTQDATIEFLQAWRDAIAESGVLDGFDATEWAEYLT